MTSKKQLDSIIAQIIEKIHSDPKKAATLVTDWIRRPSNELLKEKQTQSEQKKPETLTVRKKSA